MRLIVSIATLAFAASAAPAYAQSPGLLHRWNGDGLLNAMGDAVDGAGDVNNDGYADVIVGAYGTAVNGLLWAGAAYIYSGFDGAELYRWEADPTWVEAQFGDSVAGPGDLNSDGYHDLVVAAPGTTLGDVYAYSGFDGSVLYHWQGSASTGGFGRQVARAGDTNGDGSPDIAVTAVSSTQNGVQYSGAVFIYSGSDGSLLRTIDGSTTRAFLGFRVAGGFDINGDGYDDLIATAGETPSDSKTVHAYSGFDGTLLHSWSSAIDYYGYAISGVGDLNGDGHDDVVVGATSYYDSALRTTIGKVFVYSGLDGSTLFELTAPSEYTSRLGASVSAIDDLNGDDIDDILASASTSSYNGYRSGAVFAFSGVDGSILERWDGEFNLDSFGTAVASAGDTNNDGYPDIISGTRFSSLGGKSSGAAYVYSGRIGEPDLSIRLLIESVLAVVECTNCTPNGQVYVAWSLHGPGPVSTPFGMAQVTPPYKTIQLTADNSGVAQAQFDVPTGFAGTPIWAHGVDVNSATLLNPIATVIR